MYIWRGVELSLPLDVLQKFEKTNLRRSIFMRKFEYLKIDDNLVSYTSAERRQRYFSCLPNARYLG